MGVDSAEQWKAIVNNVENVCEAFHSDGAEIEVVAHGKGIGLMRTGCPERKRIEAAAQAGITFAACENDATAEFEPVGSPRRNSNRGFGRAAEVVLNRKRDGHN